MKVRASVKKICNKCQIIKRKGVLRVICENQHLIRLDLEDTSPISKENESSLITNIKSHIGTNTDLILLSDYAKGTITPNLCSKLINQAKIVIPGKIH